MQILPIGVSHSSKHSITLKLYILFCSGCPEAVKVLVGNKCDLPADVDLSQVKVSCFVPKATLYLNRCTS